MKRLTLLVIFAAMVALPACGGGTGSILGLPKLPTPTPAPVLSVLPATVTLSLTAANNVAKTATITASENSANAFYTAASNDVTIATVTTTTSQNAFLITAVKAGTATIAVTDSNGTAFNVPVTVGP